MSKKLDIAYFNAQADKLGSITYQNWDKVIKLARELAIFIKRQTKHKKWCIKRRIDDSMHCFFELFWYGSWRSFSPETTRYAAGDLLDGLNKSFYGELTIEVYQEYQKLFQAA